jgi:hypothetical protein
MQWSDVMLIEDGYMHSLRALMEKIRIHESEVAARNGSSSTRSETQSSPIIGRIVQMWTCARGEKTSAIGLAQVSPEQKAGGVQPQ